MYSEAFLEDLKSRVAVSDVIGRSTKLRRDGKEFRAVDNASLTINDAKGIWFDHATNEGGDALAWLQKSQGLSFTDAVAEIASMAGVPLPNGNGEARPQQGTATKRKPVASYNYCDSQGELIYEVVRLEWIEDGKLRKTFRQRRPDPGRPNAWIWNLEGIKHGLYRLPELREAGAEDVVFLPEGEKDVETLIGFGLCATTNSGGAKNWRQDHAELLRGRDVVVLVDNDEPGRERGKAIVASLHGVAKRVRILDFAHPDIWPGAPKHADVTDWASWGREGNAEDLAAIIETLPDAKPAAAVTAEDPPPPTEIPESADADPDHAPPLQVEITSLPPLTVDDWIARDLPQPDFLSGHWLTTTSRVLLSATTGLGKSNLGIALGMRIAAGVNFLHWDNERAARVLYIDGEMSRRLLRQRIIDEAGRVGQRPRNFHALSSEDIPDFKALNTAEGQLWISALIKKLGGIDLIIFDNIMSLIAGDMKDEEPWQQTLPWVRWLTRQAVGQIWIHHTGHDETRSYGTKTREWQMDTVIHLDAVKRDETDISFCLQFKKARERTPATRLDFQDVKIALVNDRWEHELTDARPPAKVSPQTEKALDALMNVLAGDQVVMLPGSRRAAHRDHWAAECNARGLIDINRKEKSATTIFNRFRRELVAANRIACEGDLQWLLR
jgi:hypothetical protein